MLYNTADIAVCDSIVEVCTASRLYVDIFFLQIIASVLLCRRSSFDLKNTLKREFLTANFRVYFSFFSLAGMKINSLYLTFQLIALVANLVLFFIIMIRMTLKKSTQPFSIETIFRQGFLPKMRWNCINSFVPIK